MKAAASMVGLLLVAGLALPLQAGQEASGAAERAAAVFAEGESLMRLGRLQQARERFEAIIGDYPEADYPDLVWRSAARVRLADLRWRSGAESMAGVGYVEVLDSEPASEWTARAQLGLAAVTLARGDWTAAADLLQRIVVATQTGDPAGDPMATEEALRRLTLLDRFHVRALDGTPPWTESGVLVVRGLQLDEPIGVAAGSEGQLLVIDEGIPAVVLVDAERSRADRLAYNDHARPWWGSDGLPYLPTRRAGVIALGGSRVGFLANEDGRAVPLKELEAGVRTGAGRWYLLDGDPPRVLRFGAEGDFQGLVTARHEEPVDVAIDPRGRLHVLDRGSGTVVRFELDGRREGVVARGTWRRAEAIEVDSLGNVYVLDRDARIVDVFDPQGQRVYRLGPTLPGGVQLRGPRDLAVDGAGHVYIADRNGSAIVVAR